MANYGSFPDLHCVNRFRSEWRKTVKEWKGPIMIITVILLGFFVFLLTSVPRMKEGIRRSVRLNKVSYRTVQVKPCESLRKASVRTPD